MFIIVFRHITRRNKTNTATVLYKQHPHLIKCYNYWKAVSQKYTKSGLNVAYSCSNSSECPKMALTRGKTTSGGLNAVQDSLQFNTALCQRLEEYVQENIFKIFNFLVFV